MRWGSCDLHISHQQALSLHFPSMYILIENEETSEYLTEIKYWSKNPLKGERFPSGNSAESLSILATLRSCTVAIVDL
jgi:hypothetical protein